MKPKSAKYLLSYTEISMGKNFGVVNLLWICSILKKKTLSKNSME